MSTIRRLGQAVIVLGWLAVWWVPAQASPAAQGQHCTIRGDKVASPARIHLGDTVQIRLSLTPDCPPSVFRAADIVLVVDQSRSMLNGGKLTAAKNAARVFVEATDLTLHRVAVVSFYYEAVLRVSLTQDQAALLAAIDRIDVRSGTNIAAGLDLAYSELVTSGRPEALPVIVLISDGEPNRPHPDPATAAIRSANAAKLGGVEIITVGLGVDADEDLLRAVASSDADYYYSPSAAELEAIYRSIAVLVGDYAVRDLTLEDVLAPEVELEPGSAVPAAQVNGKTMRWTAGLVPSSGLVWVYQVRPTRVGTYPTNDRAEAVYTDADGSEQQFTFPQPVITVLDPREEWGCDPRQSWTITVHSFPDGVGVSGSGYPGCNNRFDGGDWILGTGYHLPALEFEVSGEEGQVLYRGTSVPGPGRVDQRLYIRVCEPPPYRLRLVTTELAGFRLCPNSPAERVITGRDFRPTAFRRTEERFGFVR